MIVIFYDIMINYDLKLSAYYFQIEICILHIEYDYSERGIK